ncbi:MAG: FKBP-type peptidyl-prolyl cis-trans isomerase [Betaproteobacteria bacterium]|nr:FKBP-type peptidyl-prolyl cis-trans isomerase [Betaproteobacteria bacterium]
MTASPTLRPGHQVTLHYRLECAGQEVADTFTAGPETFTLGQGEMEARLELLLLGLAAGDHRRFELGPGEAFGDHDAALVHTLPRSDFPADMALEAGGGVEFTLPNGQVLTGGVLEIGPDTVKVDFNHPLAGMPVNFEVQILSLE